MFGSRQTRSYLVFTICGNRVQPLGVGSDIIALYSASKFAIRGLTQAAGTPFFTPHVHELTVGVHTTFTAREFGKHNITVNAYAPGGIDTRMSQSFLYLSTSTLYECL